MERQNSSSVLNGHFLDSDTHNPEFLWILSDWGNYLCISQRNGRLLLVLLESSILQISRTADLSWKLHRTANFYLLNDPHYKDTKYFGNGNWISKYLSFRNVTKRSLKLKLDVSSQRTLSFTELSEIDVAEQITYLDWKASSKIHVRVFNTYKLFFQLLIHRL